MHTHVLPPPPRFLHCLEVGYLDNPYHSRVHAADVLRTMHITITQGGLIPGYVDSTTHLACYLAAVRGGASWGVRGALLNPDGLHS